MRQKVFRGLVAGAALGLVLGGGGLGYLLGSHHAHRPIVVHAAPLSAIASPSTTSRPMPSLYGLSEDAARAALAVVQISGESVTLQRQAAATAPGVVVGQRPNAGTTVGTGSAVTLVISDPATMPDVVGQSETAARSALQGLGAQVKTTGVYVEGTPPGSVISATPAVGAALVGTAELTVAAAPSTVFLSALRAVSNNCSTGTTESVNGTSFSDSMSCQVSPGSTSTAEYLLGRHVASLTMVVGQSDRGATGSVMNLQVLADGQVVAEQRVTFGTATTITTPLSGALRLSLRISTEGVSSCCNASPSLVLGSAKLVGAPDAIDQLIAESKGN